MYFFLSTRNTKFLAIEANAGFKKYSSCHQGQMKVKTCPNGSIFYFAIQCCVPISKFPCQHNCLEKKSQETRKTKQDFRVGNNKGASSSSNESKHGYDYFLE